MAPQITKKTAELVYKYSLEDGRVGDGFICSEGLYCGRRVRVDTSTLCSDPDLENNIDMYKILFQVSHESLLDCLWLDSANKNIIYDYFDSYLKDMKNPKCVLTYKIVYQKEMPKDSYKMRSDGKKQIYKGQQSEPRPSKQYQYINKIHRTIFREMVRFVCYIHDQGLCLKSLSLENLVLQEGKYFKFYGIHFLQKNNARESQDFIYLADVIKSLLDLTGDYDRIPADFAKFLACLREFNHNDNNNSVEDYEHFFQNHIALLPFEDRIFRVRQYWDKKDEYGSKQLEKALTAMEVRKNWIRERFCTYEWAMVYEVIKHGSGIDDQFDFASEFLKFCRHLASHLEQKLKNYKPHYTNMDVDLTIMAAGGRELASFEEAAFKQSLFRKLAQ